MACAAIAERDIVGSFVDAIRNNKQQQQRQQQQQPDNNRTTTRILNANCPTPILSYFCSQCFL
jgi:membrane protease subunit (stomatin/prohibitin family)